MMVGRDVIFDIQTMDAYAMCIDRRGNMLWQEIWGGLNQDNIRFIIPTEDGGCFLIGRYDEIKPGEQYAQVTTWVLKLTDEGNLEWDADSGFSVNRFLQLGRIPSRNRPFWGDPS